MDLSLAEIGEAGVSGYIRSVLVIMDSTGAGSGLLYIARIVWACEREIHECAFLTPSNRRRHRPIPPVLHHPLSRCQ